MPMDYDDNDFQSQNLHLALEGSSTVSPVLRSYALPKFDFDDSLQGNLRFDSLVENEVFLGITSQDDNQWIEEYSRGSSGIEFSSSAAESRRNNVWSEATSSESVEMLLKSVGQEERVAGETITKELDAGDVPASLATIMDPNSNQDDRVVPNENFLGFNASSDYDKSHVRFTSQSQETQVSGEDDVNQKVAVNLANEVQESTVSQQNFNASNASDFLKASSSNEDEYSIKSKETSIVETSSYRAEKPFVVSEVESVDNPPSEVSIPDNEESTSLMPIEDGPAKPEIFGSLESNVSSPSKVSLVQSHSFEETENAINENVVVSSNTHCGDSSDKDRSPTAEFSGSLQVNDEIRSSEPSATCMYQDVTFNDSVDARLPTGCNNMDVEVVGTPDSKKNVESTSSAEGCKEVIAMAQGSEADMTVLAEPNRAEPVTSVKSDITSPPNAPNVHLLSRSVGTDDIATNSPIFGVSLMHHDKDKKPEVGFLSEGSSQNGAPEVASRVDCISEGTLAVVEKSAFPDHTRKDIHEMVGHCAEPVENTNAITSEQATEANLDGPGCTTTSDTSPPRCDSSAKVGDNVEAGGRRDPEESIGRRHGEPPRCLAVNMSNEQQTSIDVARLSDCDANHKKQDESSSVPSKPQVVSSSETSSIELSQSVQDTHDGKSPQGKKVQLVSSTSDTKGDKSFTFEVNASVGLGHIDKGLQSIPAIQACNLSTKMEGPSINSSSNLLNPGKPGDISIANPQTPSGATIQVGVKDSERKTRRKSAGKESAKKGTRHKETTPRQSGRVEKSSASLTLTTPATGHIIQFEELKRKENVECSIMEPGRVLPVSTSNLPDLNNSSAIFQQPFTDSQQVQLRAQILVYGSLISGAPPDEPHMIAAFGQSDGGRKVWEATWRACLERKSPANNPDTPMQSRSDLKDIGHRTSDPSKVFSTPVGGSTNKGTPPSVVSPLIPLSSPLWNIATPSVGFPSSGIPRTILHDYRQALSPLHPYQTPSVLNLAGHNPPWLSPGPFGGPWVASSPVSTFNAGLRFSTEAVKLTPVKVSGAPGIKNTSSIPVVDSTSPNVYSGSSSQASDSKSRKRKKGNTSVAMSQTIVPSQVQGPVPAPLVAHLAQVPRIEGHGQIPLPAQKPTDSITAPVVSSLFSTSVTVSTPPSVTSKTGTGGFLSVSSTHDHPRFADKKVNNVVISETLSKAEDSKVQAVDAAAATAITFQTSGDSKSTKRKRVASSPAVNQTSVPKQVPVVAHLPSVRSESHGQVSLLVQNQTESVTSPNVTSLFPTPTVYSASTRDYPRTGSQNMEKAVVPEDTLSKVEESKLQAENAAMLAANEVAHFQGVWSQLEQQKRSGVVSDDEATLMSSSVSIAAAASVAKMAAAAAKFALNAAEQARLMADETLGSIRTENFDRSGMISHLNVNKFDKATPASILKTADTSNHPNSIISAAREAARRRIEAASAASKHAENLDAIVKAAELAAEAVSQVGKIVSMGDPSALRKLVEAGPQGYWKTPQRALDHQGETSDHVNRNSDKKNIEAAPNVPIKDIHTLKYGLSPKRDSGHFANNPMMLIDGVSGPVTGHEKDTRIPDLSKTVGVAPERDNGSFHKMPQRTSGAWEEHDIKEGCLVEVFKDDGKYKGAWFAANILSLKDEKALVCYTEIQSDEGSEKLKEWVPLEIEEMKAPRIRIAHPMTTMRFEGSRKRRRTAVTDYAWSNGDRVDVWMQDCWREGVVMEPNILDVTSLTVQFPAQGDSSVVRHWHVRPSLIWKDGRWIEWPSLKGGCSTETPKQKRKKLGSPVKEKPKLPENIDILESGNHEESRKLPLSTQETSFNVGKTENKLNTVKTMRSGLQKEGQRVVFGVPKPGKKQKFMDVSKHYVGDKNNTKNDSMKFSRYLKPQAPGPRGWKINSRNDESEKQVAETKSRLKPRKPPVPTFRTVAQKKSDLVSSKSAAHEAEVVEKSDRDSVSDVENVLSNQNQMEFGSSSNTEDATKGPDAPKKVFGFTSNARSKRLNKGKLAPAGGRMAKVEEKEKSDPEVMEPRRSNRRIQPTSRLLEGLQSSLTISKIPSVSHGSQRRSHNKGTPKGNNNHG